MLDVRFAFARAAVDETLTRPAPAPPSARSPRLGAGAAGLHDEQISEANA